MRENGHLSENLLGHFGIECHNARGGVNANHRSLECRRAGVEGLTVQFQAAAPGDLARLGGERRVQARRLVEIARRHTIPTVMLGDFNDFIWPGSLRAALKREFPARSRQASFPSWLPLLRLDRIFCWPRETELKSFVDREARMASDHLPVVADIAFPCIDATG